MALIRFILIAVIIYYALRFILRLVAPFLISYLAKRMNNNSFQKNPFYNKRKEGDVTIKGGQHKDKKVSDNVGEYVDYEEVDE